MDDVLELPGSFAAGTSLEVRRSHADYPADDGWTYNLYLAGPSIVAGVVAVADGKTFLVGIPAAETAKLKPGVYQWAEWYTKGAKVKPGESGRITVQRNISTATKGEFSSWAQGALSAVESRITGRAGIDVESYQIDGMAVSRIPFKDLFDLRDRLQRLVNAEAGDDGRGAILIEFNAVGYDR